MLDTVTGDGFVVASASNRAAPLHSAITNLFFDASYGPGTRTSPAPVSNLELLSIVFLAVSAVLVLVLMAGVVRFVRDVRASKRVRVDGPSWRSLARALPWVLSLVFGWYTLYSPLTLYLPAWYPDLWPTIGSRVLLGTLMAGIAFRFATAFFPRRAAGAAEDPGQPSIKHATHQANDRATSSPGPVSPG